MISDMRKAFLQAENKDRKTECTKRLFEKEKKLFEYCELMENNPCIEVCIRQNGVYATFDINGHLIKMGLDEKDMAAVPYTILMQGFYEKEEMDMVLAIMPYMKENAIIFDVGANLGWYGINLKKRFPTYQVHFFEPVPETYKRLLQNGKLNNIEQCYINNVGLSNRSGNQKFYYDITASGASSMADLRELETTEQMSVRMLQMDEYVLKNAVPHVDFIKCDVEGAELLVYQGGIESIKKYKPVVFSEMLRKWSAKFGYHPNDIIDFFEELGYQCFVIQGGCLKKFGRVNEETIETNYFFLHTERHAAIIQKLCR